MVDLTAVLLAAPLDGAHVLGADWLWVADGKCSDSFQKLVRVLSCTTSQLTLLTGAQMKQRWFVVGMGL